MRTQGGALGARAPPPPHLKKTFRSETSKRGKKVPPRYVGKKECAFRPDTTKIKQKGKKKTEKSKTKGIKEVKKEDSRLSEIEIIKKIVSHLFTITVVFELNKQMILAFIFVFVVYHTVCYVFKRLFWHGGTGPKFLKS